MKICRKNAMILWEEIYGNNKYAYDFAGRRMCRDAYNDRNYYEYAGWNKIYCGWNIHHIVPLANGGTNAKENLICTNITTNDEAEDKTTFWIGNNCYQVRKNQNTYENEIVKIRTKQLGYFSLTWR